MLARFLWTPLNYKRRFRITEQMDRQDVKIHPQLITNRPDEEIRSSHHPQDGTALARHSFKLSLTYPTQGLKRRRLEQGFVLIENDVGNDTPGPVRNI